ncbi:hypothetical protein LshimejAT787_1303130 [Lyophyllum shimeji]|uniref:Uncharacterized protein n=1 Tax=Lyophyllum shimeji TaxID=47721 RepID=A0A9P3PY73_LYOSH|nr:hypothetical protein LshimejAT787_1303130 [Lyophyllum shimeji]
MRYPGRILPIMGIMPSMNETIWKLAADFAVLPLRKNTEKPAQAPSPEGRTHPLWCPSSPHLLLHPDQNQISRPGLGDVLLFPTPAFIRDVKVTPSRSFSAPTPFALQARPHPLLLNAGLPPPVTASLPPRIFKTRSIAGLRARQKLQAL